MANSPLLGSRISLISKKNIRYEGTLYSIHEADATVALAEVRSYGTEGREKLDGLGAAYVPPQDTVHPYLLFRGCDIKDLHVHERRPEDVPATQQQLPPDPAIVSTQAPPSPPAPESAPSKEEAPSKPTPLEKSIEDTDERTEKRTRMKSQSKEEENEAPPAAENSAAPQTRSRQTVQRQNGTGLKSSSQYTRNQNTDSFRGARSSGQNRWKRNEKIGTGACLLHRKERGVVENAEGQKPVTPGKDFDFESSAAAFQSKAATDEDENETPNNTFYTKDDFFDSISCDAIDKRDGIDNRLRGSQERSLNTETFGAVSLGSVGGRRGGRRSRRGGRGRGGRSGRSGRGEWKRGGHSNASRVQYASS